MRAFVSCRKREGGLRRGGGRGVRRARRRVRKPQLVSAGLPAEDADGRARIGAAEQRRGGGGEEVRSEALAHVRLARRVASHRCARSGHARCDEASEYLQAQAERSAHTHRTRPVSLDLAPIPPSTSGSGVGKHGCRSPIRP
eukprot:2864640-Pleurochrysis_carterae.AAC.3